MKYEPSIRCAVKLSAIEKGNDSIRPSMSSYDEFSDDDVMKG